MSASLVAAVGLPELICADFAAYERQAIELARNPGRLVALRQKLEANRLAQPLFDTEKFTRHFERSLESVWETHHAG